MKSKETAAMRLTPSPKSERHGAITAVVCLALAAVVAAMASLNVALPDIARDTHASQTDLVWVIDAYSLAFAALLLPGGGIGDRYGRRVALIIGLAIFGGGSAIAMTATSAGELIALRAVLGLLASGVLLAEFSWRWVFGVNVLLAGLAVVGTLRFVPESADPDAPR